MNKMLWGFLGAAWLVACGPAFAAHHEGAEAEHHHEHGGHDHQE